MVLCREGNVDLALLADVLSNQLLLKGIDEGMGADGQRIILSFSALKALAVYKAFEIDHGLITISYRTILNSQKPCVLLLNSLKLCLNILAVTEASAFSTSTPLYSPK